MPFYTQADKRIEELAEAILWGAEHGLTSSVKQWAQEIEAQCDLIDRLMEQK